MIKEQYQIVSQLHCYSQTVPVFYDWAT